MLVKAQSSVAKEMDLIKFIQRQRLSTFTTLAALNGRQQYVADKMATKLIRESSDFDNSPDDDFLIYQDQENERDEDRLSRGVFKSDNVVDRRLANVY